MSFILDALKKSENERQRKIGPSLADVPVRRQQNVRPWWVIAVAALLVINLGVLVIVLLRNDDAGATPTTAPVAAGVAVAPPPYIPPAPSTQASPQTPRSNPVVTTSPAVRSLADEAIPPEELLENVDPANPHLAAAANVPEGPPMVRPIEPPAVTPLPAQPTFESRPAATSNEVLPTPNDLAASGTTLPDLHLDIHVFSNQAPDRFVLVNMRKYVEGESLQEGPAVERITPEGVVLNHRGLRFLLPRQ
jgi:general secretion pathway protein B